MDGGRAVAVELVQVGAVLEREEDRGERAAPHDVVDGALRGGICAVEEKGDDEVAGLEGVPDAGSLGERGHGADGVGEG